jgi:hypothetical protein
VDFYIENSIHHTDSLVLFKPTPVEQKLCQFQTEATIAKAEQFLSSISHLQQEEQEQIIRENKVKTLKYVENKESADIQD